MCLPPYPRTGNKHSALRTVLCMVSDACGHLQGEWRQRMLGGVMSLEDHLVDNFFSCDYAALDKKYQAGNEPAMEEIVKLLFPVS